MFNWRPILHKHNIDILHNGFEKRRWNARMMEFKSADIAQLETSVKSDE